jgi:hypothetical protein
MIRSVLPPRIEVTKATAIYQERGIVDRAANFVKATLLRSVDITSLGRRARQREPVVSGAERHRFHAAGLTVCHVAGRFRSSAPWPWIPMVAVTLPRALAGSGLQPEPPTTDVDQRVIA